MGMRATKIAGLLGLLAFGVLLAVSAQAAPCGQGSPKARYLTLSTADENARNTLAAALHMALRPYDFPVGKIALIAQPCRWRDFHARDGLYTLYGDGYGEPQRYAMRKNDLSRVAYLALMPLPMPAVAAIRAGPSKDGNYHFKHGQMIYVLAVADESHGYQRDLFHFYDVIPDDQTLAIDMCAALSGDDAPIGAYNGSFGTTTFYVPSSPKKQRRMFCRIVTS